MPSVYNRPSIRAFALLVCLILGALQLAGCSSREQRAAKLLPKRHELSRKEGFCKSTRRVEECPAA